MLYSLVAKITGLVVLCGIFETIMPDTAYKKYVKGAVSLVFMLIIFTTFTTPVSFSELFTSDGTKIEADSGIVDQVDNIRVRMFETETKSALEKQGISGAKVKITARKEENVFVIVKAEVNLQNAVLNGLPENINITVTVKNLVSSLLKISADAVVCYGK